LHRNSDRQAAARMAVRLELLGIGSAVLALR